MRVRSLRTAQAAIPSFASSDPRETVAMRHYPSRGQREARMWAAARAISEEASGM